MAIKDYYNTGDDNATGIYGNQWRGQSFTAGSSYSIGSVKLKIYRNGTPGNITVAIYSTSSGKPDSSLTSVTIDGSLLEESAAWYEFTFSTPYSLTNGTKYAIVVSAPSAPTNGVLWRIDVGGSYAGGSLVYSTNGGAAWSEDASSDAMFETYEAVPSVVEFSGTITTAIEITGSFIAGGVVEFSGSISTAITITGSISFVYVLFQGSIAATLAMSGSFSLLNYTWDKIRPGNYDAEKVWDEATKKWVYNDGRGGSRFGDKIVVFGRNNSGSCDVYVSD